MKRCMNRGEERITNPACHVANTRTTVEFYCRLLPVATQPFINPSASRFDISFIQFTIHQDVYISGFRSSIEAIISTTRKKKYLYIQNWLRFPFKRTETRESGKWSLFAIRSIDD